MGIKIRKVYNVKNKEVVAMAKDIDYSKIGLRISSLRKKAGLTQEALAARCDCTSNHLGNVEVGKSKPSLDLVIELAQELQADCVPATSYAASCIARGDCSRSVA